MRIYTFALRLKLCVKLNICILYVLASIDLSFTVLIIKYLFPLPHEFTFNIHCINIQRVNHNLTVAMYYVFAFVKSNIRMCVQCIN